MLTFEEYKKEYGISLDENQEKACREIDGKRLILAVPGSGKTSVMIARLGYMTRALGIHPSSLLAITYSVAGTKEMKIRYEKLFGFCDVEFRTIHGFCATLINRYERLRGRKAFTLMEKENEPAFVLKKIMAELGSYPNENELREAQTALSYCKNGMLSYEDIEKEIVLDGRSFIDIYKAYEEYKLNNRLMDYDDQLVYGYKILKTCPDVNAVYTDRFKYICVDEAQDTSKLQHKIIELLTNKTGNLFMVGDEDQSIYGFRASYPQALIDFGKTYPDSDIITLNKNYRSTKKIVDLASSFIKKNTERVNAQKTMFTDNEEGAQPTRVKLSDLKLLPEYVRRAAKEKQEGTTALLFRLNDSMLPVIDLFNKKDIPFRLRGNDGLFFSHTVVSDVINILKFASDPYDSRLFSMLYYKLNLGLSKAEANKILSFNMSENNIPFPDYIASLPYINESKRKRAQKLKDDLYLISRSDTYEAIRTIFFSSGYGRYYSHRSTDVSKRNALLAIAERYRSRDEFFTRLKELEGVVKRGSVSTDGIFLSTIHSSKGMEFDRVILCDCKNGVLPSFELPQSTKDLDDTDKRTLEEDRRLFYVGATRAKKKLEFITWEREFGILSDGFDFVDEFFGNEKKASLTSLLKVQTVSEEALEEEKIRELMEDYFEGVCVRHKQFGDGVISAKKGDFVQIKFASYPIPKKLSLYTCIENKLICQI